jgi:hypothetical protein
VAALFDVAAQGCGATDLDGAHHAQLIERQATRLPVARAVFSKNVSQLESGPYHRKRSTLGLRVGLAHGPVAWVLMDTNESGVPTCTPVSV